MVMSVMPMRWVSTACWLCRGRSSTADWAWQIPANNSSPGSKSLRTFCMKDSFNWDFSRVWPSRGSPNSPTQHDASLRRMEVMLVSRWNKYREKGRFIHPHTTPLDTESQVGAEFP